MKAKDRELPAILLGRTRCLIKSPLVATPFSTTVKAPQPNATADEETGDYLSSEWEIHIHASCYSGKNPTGPGGMVPIPFLQYIDQGVTYTYEVKFTYEEFE